MTNLLFPLQEFSLVLAKSEIWVPSRPFLLTVLVIGAFLTAGVALSALSFYEDFYWRDKKFRDQLRLHPTRR